MRDLRYLPAVDARLCLLGGFALDWQGRSVLLPDKARRLVAMVALRGPMPRVTAAGHFWPDHRAAEALARLRTTIWRANSGLTRLIDTRDGRLSLAPWVWVDVLDVQRRAARVAHAVPALVRDQNPATDTDIDTDAAALSDSELLPEWDDQWVLEEREQIRQWQLHALEALAWSLLKQQRYSQALDSATRAVRIEPMRESAQRAVIEVHLAQSNVAAAVRQYSNFQQLLLDEIGVGPSRALAHLVMSASSASSSAPNR
jgi:DNA-binding SARP family transcriptional activator